MQIQFRRVAKSLLLALLFNSLAAAAAPLSSENSNELSRSAVLGPWSLSAGFPNGGSIWGAPALGLRNEVAAGEFVSIGLNLSADKAGKSESMGLFAKWNHMLFAPLGKAFPYAFLQCGVLSQKSSEASKKETTLMSAAGFGVEVSLLREISTSLETGLGGNLWPSTNANYSAATTQISMHYHFQY